MLTSRYISLILLLLPCFYFGIGPFAHSSLLAQGFGSPCSLITCGNLNASFDANGSVSFCEGENITLVNTSDAGFEYFLIDWMDGTVDSVSNYDPISHTYNNVSDDPCSPPVEFNVRFRGILTCANGYSCASGGYDFSLIPDPNSDFNAPSEVCVGDPVNFRENACNEDVTSYEWDFGDGDSSTEANPTHTYDTPGTYTVRFRVRGLPPCTTRLDEEVRTVTVVERPDAVFASSDPDNIACAGDRITFTNQSNQYSDITWSISGSGWSFTDTLMTVNSDVITVQFDDVRTYTVRLTGQNACATEQDDITISILTAPSVTLTAPAAACESVTLTTANLPFTISGDYDEVCWVFTSPSLNQEICEEDFGSVTFTESGTVTLTVSGSCGDLTRMADVNVQSGEIPQLIADSPYCTGSARDTLRSDLPDGLWDGPGIVDRDRGIFDPADAGPGTHRISYEIDAGACTNENTILVEVLASASVMTDDATLCETDAAVQLTASPGPGNWSGTGITDPANGIFDPDTSGIGTFQPEYAFVDANGCRVTARPTVLVEALPTATITDSSLICLVDQALSLEAVTGVTATPATGSFTWSVAGSDRPSGTINPVNDLPGPGFYPVVFEYRNSACVITDSATLEVVENPVLALEPVDDLCISAGSYQLVSNLPGNDWSGPGVDPATGLIDLAAAGGGTHRYRFVFQPGGSCEQSAEVIVTVEDPGATVSAGDPETICEGRDLTFELTGGSPADGNWTGPALTGTTVDVTQLLPDSTYLYTYTVTSEAATDCSASATRPVRYGPRPGTGFTLDGGSCVGETFTLTATGNGTFDWDLGDGRMETSRSVTHAYTEGGRSYSLNLSVTSANDGCPADTSWSVYVTSPPVPSFELDSTTGCAPFVLQLADGSSGDQFTSRWVVLGDTLPGGPLNYVLDGFLTDTTIDVTLIAENFCGARPQVQSLLVKPYPVVDFGFDVPTGCSPYLPGLSNVTLGNPDFFRWDLGNGETSTDSIPELTEYTTPEDSISRYPFTLVAGNECGLDTLEQTLTVRPPNVAAFISLDTVAGCQPWTFSPRSLSTPGANLAWSVTDPDGTEVASGSSPTPTFTLNEPGLHRIILRAADCGADADTSFVDVLPAPAVSLVAPDPVCREERITLRQTSTDISGGQWTLGDGRTTEDLNPVVAYDSAGTFPLTFTALSAINGCPASATGEITVRELPEVAIAPQDTSGCPPFTTVFNATSTGTGLSYDWTFGDGSNNETGATPSHTYGEAGNYSPVLSVTDAFGCSGNARFDRILVHELPVPGFLVGPDLICAGYDSIRLTSTAMGASSYQWITPDTTLSGPNPSPLPAGQPGAVIIRQVVSNSFGCTAEESRTAVVAESPFLSPNFSPTEHCAGEVLRLSAGGGGYTDLRWELGDGSGSTDSELTHRFAGPGSYEVELTAGNDNGCPSVTARQSVVVYPIPTAAYTVVSDLSCGTPAIFRFTNTSRDALRYEWAFGDGGTAEAPDPTHTFDTPGDYPAQLIAISEFGCRDSTVRTLSVSGAPVADFNRPPVLACAPYPARLSALETEAARYEWYLNDDFSPIPGRTLDTLLSEPGTYDIRLIAIFDERCRDTFTLLNAVTVEESPVADFDYVADSSPNRLGDVRFRNLSIGGTEFFWDLGDGTITDVFEPDHDYRINRDIEVLLAVTSRYERGLVCSDTLIQPVAPEWLTRFYVPTALAIDSGPEEVRTWGAKGFGVREYTLEVFSPYGQRIFTTGELEDSVPTGRWDGSYPGNSDYVLQGSYTWRASVTYVDGSTDNLLGTVTVLR